MNITNTQVPHQIGQFILSTIPNQIVCVFGSKSLKKILLDTLPQRKEIHRWLVESVKLFFSKSDRLVWNGVILHLPNK